MTLVPMIELNGQLLDKRRSQGRYPPKAMTAPTDRHHGATLRRLCPDCRSRLITAEAGWFCRDCGWEPCGVTE